MSTVVAVTKFTQVRCSRYCLVRCLRRTVWRIGDGPMAASQLLLVWVLLRQMGHFV